MKNPNTGEFQGVGYDLAEALGKVLKVKNRVDRGSLASALMVSEGLNKRPLRRHLHTRLAGCDRRSPWQLYASGLFITSHVTPMPAPMMRGSTYERSACA